MKRRCDVVHIRPDLARLGCRASTVLQLDRSSQRRHGQSIYCEARHCCAWLLGPYAARLGLSYRLMCHDHARNSAHSLAGIQPLQYSISYRCARRGSRIVLTDVLVSCIWPLFIYDTEGTFVSMSCPCWTTIDLIRRPLRADRQVQVLRQVNPRSKVASELRSRSSSLFFAHRRPGSPEGSLDPTTRHIGA